MSPRAPSATTSISVRCSHEKKTFRRKGYAKDAKASECGAAEQFL